MSKHSVFSAQVKARAGHRCQTCESTEQLQAHAPAGDHSDPKKGISLCASHHAEQHPDVPRALFFNKRNEPYWLNATAEEIAAPVGCCSRTIIRAARRLGIPSGVSLSEEDRNKIVKSIKHYSRNKLLSPLRISNNRLRVPKEMEDMGYTGQIHTLAGVFTIVLLKPEVSLEYIKRDLELQVQRVDLMIKLKQPKGA